MPAIRFGFRLAKNYYSWSDYDAGMLGTLVIEREKCPKMSKNVHNIFERKTSIESESFQSASLSVEFQAGG